MNLTKSNTVGTNIYEGNMFHKSTKTWTYWTNFTILISQHQRFTTTVKNHLKPLVHAINSSTHSTNVNLFPLPL